ncbi:fibronectin type III domain-containing protein [Marinomonas transparens]|uniref:Fibronectin type III domain-containing protein n=1 Tax=Marinomonas transparens TaxID=2795388 RepID=A0A934JKB5_9GAMM|nr:fibronectin type III domain-containing protein [Marinomonas transparens]MBJ7537391.1 fibronectin type III domain-containing protein [Marinomonas transparens]
MNNITTKAITFSALLAVISGATWADSVTLNGFAGNKKVDLNWSNSGQTSAAYQVYYDTDSDPENRIRLDSVSSSTFNYTATGLDNGTPYWFWIKFLDSDTGEYSNSNAFSATPSSSFNVTLSGSGSGDQVTLQWSNSNSNSNYEVYYDTDSNPKNRERIATVSPSTTSYTVTNLDAGVPYWFWIKYTNSDGDTSNSNSFNITLDGSGPVTPPAGNGPEISNNIVVDSESEILSAINNASSSKGIYVRSGTYYFSSPIEMTKSGSSSNKIILRNYPGDSHPVFNFSSMSESSSNRGIELSGDHWHMYGIDVTRAGDNGLHITGDENIIEFSSFSRNADTGVQLDNGASNNLIKNVDSYYNADSSLENADGFAAKLTVGSGNYFYGCRAWNNLDDGVDGYLRGANNVTTTYENTWVFRNGYLENGSLGDGDGNGFKTGGSDNKDLKHNAILINTIAAGNAVDGYDHNSNRGKVTIHNSIAYKNGRNISFSNTNKAERLEIKNTISYDPENSSDQLNASSTSISNNSWQNGISVSSGDFKGLNINDLLKPRKSDGSLPDIDFFHLKSGSDLIDAGTDVDQSYNGSAPDIGAFEY